MGGGEVVLRLNQAEAGLSARHIRRVIASAAVLVAVAAGFSLPASASQGQGVIDTISVGGGAYGVGVDPTTGTVYVTGGDGTVSVIDEATETVTATIPVGNDPIGVGVDPTTGEVYVANSDSNTVSVIDEATETVTATIPVGDYPVGVGIDPAAGTAYVTNGMSNTVSVIDEATETVTDTIPVGDYPQGVGVDPSTGTVYVANSQDDTVSVIDVSTDTVTSTISVGDSPCPVGVDPATGTVYVGNGCNGDSDSVSVIDVSTDTVTATIAVGRNPQGVGVDPATGKVYVANTSDSTVSVIGTTAPTIVQLGDSIASGEGTLYGYEYFDKSKEWDDGNLDATWGLAGDGDYQLCHDSPFAYGQVVAADLGANFTQLGCTGASYSNGISKQEVDRQTGQTMRPAEFGTTEPDVNATFVNADPAVILVTFGADDVQFVKVVESCIISASYPVSKNPGPPPPPEPVHDCVAGNPGSVFTGDFTDFETTLKANYPTLVNNIDTALGYDPHIIFTGYMNPFPVAPLTNPDQPEPNPHPLPGALSTTCPDTGNLGLGINLLSPEQMQFLGWAITQLNGDIQTAVADLPSSANASYVDITNVLAGHTWCSADPWDYGFSTAYTWQNLVQWLAGGSYTQAPFHPTPEGQEAIAAAVLPTVEQALGITALVPSITSATGGGAGSPDGITTTAGGTVTVTASGFTPSGTVNATLESLGTGSVDLGSPAAGTDGDLSFTAQIPATTASGPYQLYLSDAASGHSAILPVFVSYAPAAPEFTDASPPTTATAGQEYFYGFYASASPPAAYQLEAGSANGCRPGTAPPSWLTVDPDGNVTGVPPARTTSFTYCVTATNGVGSAATAGPFRVIVSSPG